MPSGSRAAPAIDLALFNEIRRERDMYGLRWSSMRSLLWRRKLDSSMDACLGHVCAAAIRRGEGGSE